MPKPDVRRPLRRTKPQPNAGPARLKQNLRRGGWPVSSGAIPFWSLQPRHQRAGSGQTIELAAVPPPHLPSGRSSQPG